MAEVRPQRHTRDFRANEFGSPSTVARVGHAPASRGRRERTGSAMQRVARPRERRDVALFHALHLSDRSYEVGLFTKWGIAPSVRRDLGDCFQAFFRRPQRILVRTDTDDIR